MIQSVKKEFKEKLSFAEICGRASREQIPSIVDCNDERFFAPENMILEVQNFCMETKQQVPETVGEIAAVVYNSLAKCYGDTVKEIEEITGNTYSAIYVVGGGATAVGNIAVQLLHAQVFPNLAEMRKECIIRKMYYQKNVQLKDSGEPD